MKKFICGFLSGAVLLGAVGAFAVSYVANVADFKVLVNGKEFVSDPPALEVEGRTYLPLRAMGDALGVPVSWNDELYHAEVGTAAPAPVEGEYNRNNPAPINTVQRIVVDNYTEKYTADIRILETVRGEENIAKIRKSAVTDEKANEGYELLLAKVAFTVVEVSDDKAVDVSYSRFKPFTSSNVETDSAYLHMDGTAGFNWLSGNVYAGGTIEGYVVLQVKKDDPAPKVAYGINYDGTNGVWFALQ